MSGVFQAGYWILLLVVAGWVGANLILRPRLGLLISLTLVTFSLSAFPWSHLPIKPGAVPLGVAGLTFLYFLASSESGVSARLIRNRYMLALVAFSMALIAFIPLSPDVEYAHFKATFFVLLAVVPALAFGCLCPLRLSDIRLIIKAIVFGSVLTALLVLGGGGLSADQSLVLGLGPSVITLARIVGLGAIALLVPVAVAPDLQSRLPKRVLWAATGLGLIAVIPLLGNRGAFLAAIVAMLTVLLLPLRGKAGKVRSATVMLLLVGLVAFSAVKLQSGSPQTGLAASFTQKVAGAGNVYDDVARLDYFKLAVEAFVDTSGRGLGTGGFAPFYAAHGSFGVGAARATGLHDYPHNLFFEAGAEMGVVGLGLLGILLALGFAGVRRLAVFASLEARIFLGLWVFTIANAMVSGDFVSNKNVWVIAAIPWFVLSNVASRRQPRQPGPESARMVHA